MNVSKEMAREEIKRVLDRQFSNPGEIMSSQYDILFNILIYLYQLYFAKMSFKASNPSEDIQLLPLRKELNIAVNEFVEFFGHEKVYKYFKHLNDPEFQKILQEFKSNYKSFLNHINVCSIIQIAGEMNGKNPGMNTYTQ